MCVVNLKAEQEVIEDIKDYWGHGWYPFCYKDTTKGGGEVFVTARAMKIPPPDYPIYRNLIRITNIQNQLATPFPGHFTTGCS